MKPKILTVLFAASLVAAVLIPASVAGQANGGRASVGVTRTKLGRILVDGRGRTLYLFEKDKGGRSACSGGCAAEWPPLIASGKPQAAAGARPSLLGRTRRNDGRWQVTYNTHPLYTFVGDSKKAQTNGEGVDAFGAEWYAVSPAGAKVERDDRGGGDTAPADTYGGYGNYGTR
jgi:predicted lipoprotein with Yx(FWY)xxD motif